MPYALLSFLAVVIFAMVHLWAERLSKISRSSHGKFLSIGSGIAIAYVFVDLLPKLSESDTIVKVMIKQFFPYLQRHVYVMALLGFLLFFIVDRSQLLLKKQNTYFWLSLSSYALFNFLVGYAVRDKDNPEVQPLLLFTIAIALHYFMIDYSLSTAHGEPYRQYGKWILILSLFWVGWWDFG